MKDLLVFLKEYKKESILSPLFKLLEAGMDLLVPLIVAYMINDGIAKGNRSIIHQSFLFLIALAALGLAFSFVAQYFAAKASVGFATKLRSALFHHIQSFTYRDLDQIGTDTLITRLTSDVQQVQNGVNMTLRLLLRSPFIVLGAMILAFTINVRSALIFAVIIPILALVVFLIMVSSIPLYRRAQSALDKLLTVTSEDLTGVRVIRAFRRQNDEIRRFDDANADLTELNMKVGRIGALLNPATYVLINLATIVLIHTGALQVDGGHLLQGDVVALYNYMAQIIIELIKLASLILLLNRSLACAGRISGVLSMEVSEPEEHKDTPAPVEIAPILSVSDVSFSYEGSGEDTLSHISFSVRKGEKIGIIGSTGCGKSTLVRLMQGLYEVTDGSIELMGHPLTSYPQNKLRSYFAFVPQKARLLSGSIKDNLKMGNPNASDKELIQSLHLAQAADILASKDGGLDALVEQNGRNFSGGQRQRLTIARALCKHAPILILDDASSALDMATDFKLRKALFDLPHDPTIFFISQRIATIQDCDHILVLDDGHQAGYGSHDELLETSQVYRQLYESQYPQPQKGGLS